MAELFFHLFFFTSNKIKLFQQSLNILLSNSPNSGKKFILDLFHVDLKSPLKFTNPFITPSTSSNFSIFPIFNSKSYFFSIPLSPKFVRIKIHEIAYPNKHTLGIHARSRSIFLLASLFTARFGSAPVPKPSLNPSPPPISPIIEPLSLPIPHPLADGTRYIRPHTFPYISSHIRPSASTARSRRSSLAARSSRGRFQFRSRFKRYVGTEEAGEKQSKDEKRWGEGTKKESNTKDNIEIETGERGIEE